MSAPPSPASTYWSTNVGGLYPTRRETPDGFEATLAMNFVGPHTLLTELLPLLRTAGGARCINVVSAGFKMWKTDPFTDVQSMQRFVSGEAYAHTKLLNVLAGLAWARRLTDDQITITPPGTPAGTSRSPHTQPAIGP